jgi:glycosyltransferase involved in cell wall biosynthesis
MDGWIAVSHAVQRHYCQNLGLTAIEVIHNGVDVAEIEAVSGVNALAVRGRLGLPPEGPALLCAGRFRHEKGHRYLIAALAELSRRDLRPTLVLAGTGPLLQAVVDDVSDLGLLDQVKFVGHMNHRELMGMMAAADIVVIPSTHEGLSVTAEEALMLGRPVVASRTGGLQEVIEDASDGLLVPPGDVEALASAIERLIRDQALRARLSETGKVRAERLFSASRAATAHEQLFGALRGSLQSRRAL